MARLVVALLLSLCLPQAARAQSSDNVARARLYFETGRLLFEQGDYEQAAKKFATGYDLLPRPQFLLNAGLCYQKMEQLEKARELYQRFLREAAPDDPDRQRARTWMAEVDAKLKAAPPRAAEPSPSAPPASAPATSAPPPASAPVTTAPSATPAATSGGADLTTVAATPPEKKSFLRRHWWIFPVGAVVLAGAAVGIYFAARPSSGCSGSTPCLDLR